MRGPVMLLAVVAGGVVAASAQSLPSPYRAERASAIRGLGAQEIEDLREGRGMGLARPAELNGYPGPRHVLDAVETGELHLRPDQLTAVNRLFSDMAAEAKRVGARILDEERALEAGFRDGVIDEPGLVSRLARLSTFYAELRLVHLRAHLRTRPLLDARQIRRYEELRGYAAEPEAAPPGAHDPHH